MQYSSLRRLLRHAGFSLLEMSIVIMILGIMMASIMPAVTHKAMQEKQLALQTQMNGIEEAMRAFRWKNNRLPCPAQPTLSDANINFGTEAANLGTCIGGTPTATAPVANVAVGSVPVRTLGLDDSMAFDPWGRTFTYMVDARSTGTAAFKIFPLSSDLLGNITVQARNEIASTTSDIVTQAVAVLLSHGPNGHGGYMRSGSRYSSGSTNTYEQENCNCNASAAAGTANAQFITTLNSASDVSGVTGFDDTLRYYTRSNFTTDEELFGTGASASGEFSSAYATFDSDNSYYVSNTSHSASLDFGSSTDFTFSAWVRTLSSDRRDIAGGGNAWGAGDGKHWEVMVYSTGGLRAFIDDGSNTVNTADDGLIINNGLWHHVAVVFDRDANVLRYINGSPSGSSYSIASVGSITSSMKTISVGRRGNTPQDYFSGDVKDARIYNKALSANEVQYLYTSGSAGTNPGVANLVLHYKFNDGSGTTVTDSSAAGNDGTATNITESTFWNPYTP